MILWWKRILANDFMLEKDLVKWFYEGKGFWKMILWKRIWLNDFGKWFQQNDFGPIIFAFYLFIGFRRKRKRQMSHDVTFLHFWKISENLKKLNTRSEKSSMMCNGQSDWNGTVVLKYIYIYMVYNYPWSLDTEEQFLMSRLWQGWICSFFCCRRKVRQDKVCRHLNYVFNCPGTLDIKKKILGTRFWQE